MLMSGNLKKATAQEDNSQLDSPQDDDLIIQRSSVLSQTLLFGNGKASSLGMLFNLYRFLIDFVLGGLESNMKMYKRDSNDLLESDMSQSPQSLSKIKRDHEELKNAIADLYLSIKQKTRDEVFVSVIMLQNEEISAEEEKEEREIIMQLDTYVVIEYIKSSVDIILNLKFEEIEKRLLDKQEDPSTVVKQIQNRKYK